MSRRVLHVLDASCDPTQLEILRLLVGRMGDMGALHGVCSIAPGPMVELARHRGVAVEPANQRFFNWLNFVPALPALADKHRAEIVHAWGIEAATACAARLPKLPLVLTIVDPQAAQLSARWLRSFPHDATVAAASQAIRSRLLGAGTSPERIVVIRGPVDFGEINKARKGDLRRTVVGEGGPVVLLSGPASRAGGEYFGIWAAAVVRQSHSHL